MYYRRLQNIYSTYIKYIICVCVRIAGGIVENVFCYVQRGALTETNVYTMHVYTLIYIFIYIYMDSIDVRRTT